MLPLLIVLAFLLVPVLEIFVLIQVGEVIGAWPTVGLLVAETVLGVWIVRREGRRAWRALQETVQRGVLPDRELADAALVMAGGMLLLFPGFVTDVLGFAFVLPFTRPLVRRALSAFAARRMRAAEERAATMFPPGVFPPGGGGYDAFGRPGPERVETPPGPVVRGEVIDEDDDTTSRA
ncbi:FxsA family protein [Actinomadura madurae]|uniref:FxsA family protein n=1 Tax=Actinomadura madurae TaxID=1993 RepID=UPI002026BDD1|nr:FxsA family protein [Actinomadura madurae]MCP9947775.1 FxsA family protein [Actinomadura madurae]MCP9964539.1 FxsA family protein [Actinomadura madurae]MCP9977017.1 FxsA family protein [Actinomadura madurae]MCQ0011477.1 FxsA family protein [Actinomadura madurae]MCQ0013212.1 FxsA family protein [Actinomadura madurae]